MSATLLKAGSNLERVLTDGRFAVTGECGPPKNANGGVIEEKVKILEGHVDAVNVTDNQTAVVRVCSLAAAHLAQRNGLEASLDVVLVDQTAANHIELEWPDRANHEVGALDRAEERGRAFLAQLLQPLVERLGD